MAGAVEAGHVLLGPERLVERPAEALLAHVQAGGQPGGLEIRAQQVLELGPEDRAGDEPGHVLSSGERAREDGVGDLLGAREREVGRGEHASGVAGAQLDVAGLAGGVGALGEGARAAPRGWRSGTRRLRARRRSGS